MKRITSFISRNFPTMKKHVIPSSTPLGINNKHPMKRKHRHKKHATKHLFFNKVVSYLVSDSHMYNPLVSPPPCFGFPPPKHMFTSSSGVQDDVVMPVKERNKKLIEKVVDFLEADCYLYSPLVTEENVCYKRTHGVNINSGGQMQKENTVGEGGDLSSQQLRARAVVKKTVAYGESVKHMVH